MQPITQPYFRAMRLADGVWQVLSDGVYSYVVAGDDEAVVIDPGYGCGDIRRFCEELTGKKVRMTLVTSPELRQSAAACNFETECMSAAAAKITARPLPTMAGAVIPECENKRILSDGEVIDLGGREIVAYEFPSVSAGGMIFFDRKAKVLFTGEEIDDRALVVKHMPLTVLKEKLEMLSALQSEVNFVCSYRIVFCSFLIKRYLINTARILGGADTLAMIEGEKAGESPKTSCGKTLYERGTLRSEDIPFVSEEDHARERFSGIAESKIVFDGLLLDR